MQTCHYWNGYSNCNVIKNKKCDGWNNNCKFKHTTTEHIDNMDKSILSCRKKGLCDKCKYRNIPCKTSEEESI